MQRGSGVAGIRRGSRRSHPPSELSAASDLVGICHLMMIYVCFVKSTSMRMPLIEC